MVALLFSIVAVAQKPTAFSRPDELVVTVVSSADPRNTLSQVALGAISYYDGQTQNGRSSLAKALVVSRLVRLRLTRNDGAPGHAVVRAFLARECERCTVRLDGVQLAAAPGAAGQIVRLNAVVDHVIEIEIKRTAPAGDLNAEISWEAEEL